MIFHEKKEIITLSGKPGSGKSSASKLAAAQLDFGHFSSGDLMRKLGAERGLAILDTNHAAEADDDLDRQVDGKLIEIGSTKSRVVIDSRMAWRWIQGSLKVYLDLDLVTAAVRIIDNADEERRLREHIPDDPEQYAEQLALRLASESRRYKAKYGVDPYNTKNYDLVIDTASNGIPATVGRIVGEYALWLPN